MPFIVSNFVLIFDMTDSRNSPELEPLSRLFFLDKLKEDRKIIPPELIRSLPSKENIYMLNDKELIDFELFQFSKNQTDVSYQLNRLKAAKIYFSNIKSVNYVCELLNAHDDPFEEKVELLREMHQSLSFKRRVLANLKDEQTAVSYRKESTQKAIAGLVYSFVKNLLISISHSLRFIYPAINRPGKVHFGSGVVSFFIYCWWFFSINIFNSVLTLLFLAFPQHTFNSLFQNGTSRMPFSLFDILYGSGWFTNSTFFYAGYTNKTFKISHGIQYNVPLVYILVISMIFLVNFFVIIYSIMTYFGKREVFNTERNYELSKVVFSHYDFATGVQVVVDFIRSSFYEEMQSLMNKKKPFPRLVSWKIKQIVIFLIINICVFSFFAGSCVLTLTLLYNGDLEEYYALVVSLMLTVIPILFYYFVKHLESCQCYLSLKTIFYISIVRLLIFRIMLTGFVLYFWTDVFQYKPETCHQTQLSVSFFRLIVGNFCVQLFFYTFIAEYLRRKFIDSFYLPFEKSDFDLVYHTVDILYSQFLGWVGLLFVPLIPLLNSVHLYLLLFLKANSILKNCQPSRFVWTSHEADKFLLLLTLMSFVFSIVFSSYSLLRMGESSCGPFRDVAAKIALLEKVLVWKPYNCPYLPFTEYGWSPIVLTVVTIFLCYVVIRMRSYAHSVISFTKQLENELKSNVCDNSFLLHSLAVGLKESEKEQMEEEQNSS